MSDAIPSGRAPLASNPVDASDPDAVRKDAEKYYRLWEYGTYIPEPLKESDEEGKPRA